MKKTTGDMKLGVCMGSEEDNYREVFEVDWLQVLG